jgi:hypothetical protein
MSGVREPTAHMRRIRGGAVNPAAVKRRSQWESTDTRRTHRGEP